MYGSYIVHYILKRGYRMGKGMDWCSFLNTKSKNNPPPCRCVCPAPLLQGKGCFSFVKIPTWASSSRSRYKVPLGKLILPLCHLPLQMQEWFGYPLVPRLWLNVPVVAFPTHFNSMELSKSHFQCCCGLYSYLFCVCTCTEMMGKVLKGLFWYWLLDVFVKIFYC